MQEAIAVLRKGLAVAPQAWLNGNLLSNYLSDVEDYEAAFATYEQTLQAPSVNRVLVEGNYALALSRAGKHDEARVKLGSVLDQVEEASPDLRAFINGLALDWGLNVSTAEPVAWRALLHVRPLPSHSGGLEGGAAGAYAWVFALARGEAEYREMVAAEMEALGLFIAEVDDLRRYEPHPEDDESMEYCAERLSEEWPVQYHDFDTYPHDEA
jgi:tetratricopeptide (TPR) repeat protein